MDDNHNKNQLLICNDCMMTARLDENSTGYCESCGSANVKRKDMKELVLIAGTGDDIEALKIVARHSGIPEDNVVMISNPCLDDDVTALIKAGQMVREDFEMPLMPKQSETKYHKDIMRKGRNQFKKGR